MAFIQAEHLSYSYPNSTRPALDDISFTVEEGEYLAVLGANGSGKSSLARHLNGLLTASSGSILIGGLDPRRLDDVKPIRRMVSLVFQSPNDQIISTLTDLDIAFGPENLGLSQTEIGRRVDKCLERTGLEEERHSPVHLLSPGRQQSLALADSLAMESPCLALDEATSMVSPESRNALLSELDALSGAGKTILNVTHSMDDAARAGRILVLNRGRLVFDGSPQELFRRRELAAWGLTMPESLRLKDLLAPFWDFSPGESSPPERLALPEDFSRRIDARLGGPQLADYRSSRSRPARRTALSFENVSFSYSGANGQPRQALKEVSFKLGHGEIMALIGPSGAGKSTVLQLCNAIFLPQAGRVACLGIDSSAPKLDASALRRRAALCLQRADTALFESFAADDVAYGPRLAGLKGRELYKRVSRAMETMGLPYQEFRDKHPRNLSGGERRRLAMAGILALEPELYLFDEPTSSLDPSAKAQTQGLMKRLKAEGKTVVFTTHDMEEAALADRVLVFKDGRLAFDGSPETLFYQRNPEAWGLDRPFTVKVAEALSPALRSAIGRPLRPEVLAARIHALAGIIPDQASAAESRPPSSPTERAHDSFEPAALDAKPHKKKNGNPFDIRSKIIFGQYVDTGSAFHALSPRMKFLGLFALIVPAFASLNPWAPLACLAISIAFCAMARISVSYAFRGLLPALPFFGLYLVLQFLFGSALDKSPAVLTWGACALTVSELKALASILVKLAALMGAFGFFSAIASLSQVVHGIEDLLKPLSRIGISGSRLGMVVGISFRYIPILAEEAETILKAQASRGSPGYSGGYARRVKTALSLFVPLLVRSLERAQILAEAMEARCYPGDAPTRYQVYPRSRYRILIFSLTALSGLALLALAVLVR